MSKSFKILKEKEKKTKVCQATREPQSLAAENKVNEAAASVDVLKQDFSTDRMSFFSFFQRSQKTPLYSGKKTGSHLIREGGGAAGGWGGAEREDGFQWNLCWLLVP